MGRRLIEVMQVLVDQVHKGGYQHRVLEDSIYAESQRRIAVEKDRDAARSEIDTLRKKLADAKHEDYENEIRAAAALICPEASGETTIPGMAGEILRLRKQLDEARDEIETLRKQLAEQQAETVDVRRQRNNETDRLNATNVVSVQQRDEIAYLRKRLDEERSVITSLNQQLDSALASLTGQRLNAEERDREIERLHKFVHKVRLAMWPEDLKSALTELDAATEPLDAEGGA